MLRISTPPVLYTALALIGLSLLLVFYWAVIPLDVLQIKNDPVPVRPSINAAGGAEILVHDFCKLTNDEGTLRVSFVGTTREIFLPIAKERSQKNCNNKTELPVIIPEDATPGKYHVHFRAIYHPNPLREVLEEWNSQEFNVE